jgi:catechol 2,3-dioxygenase-like lactoylglutathione lyase family enzyme
MSAVQETFDVGGVLLPRPFRIRRLGHFGVNVNEPEASLDFYCRLLGFRVSDPIDFGMRLPEAERGRHGPGVGYFMRHGGDHHSFVLFPKGVLTALNPHYRAHSGVTVNQITWQVSSLKEVVDGFDWFQRRGKRVLRSGRDLPGSNWHFYPPDTEGHINELYYGIEQIGWDGFSKPRALHKVRYEKPPPLPHRSEYAEVQEALGGGLRVESGYSAREPGEEKFDVGGVLLARPFKVVRIGPVRRRRGGAVLSRRARPCAGRGSHVRRRTLRFPAGEHRAPFAGALPAQAAREARPVRIDFTDVVRRAGGQLPSASRRGGFPEEKRRPHTLSAAGAFSRHRLLGVRDRSRRARPPALLLHGADRLGRQAAPRGVTTQGRQREMARERACRGGYLQRRGLPRTLELGNSGTEP